MKTYHLISTTDFIQAKAKQLIEFIFYGNYFYGICAIAIIVETSIRLQLHLDNPLMYVMAFMATVLFYNYPYARNYSTPGHNPRTQWYIRNRHFVIINQIIFTVALLLCFTGLLIEHHQGIKTLDPLRWLLIFIFPLTGTLYYGNNVLSNKYNLRQIGWLKPFTIGFVWAGMSNVYPILYSELIHGQAVSLTIMHVMLFLKTLMFISMLAIMFDIKDYVVDSQSQVNTLIVKIGLRKTVFFVIIPLTLLGLLTFISYALIHQFSLLKMILIMIPFILLIAATRLFRKRRSLLYYLIVIDGLFIVKAIFGIAAMLV